MGEGPPQCYSVRMSRRLHPRRGSYAILVALLLVVLLGFAALFQVADVDTGAINWVNADLVTHIVPMA